MLAELVWQLVQSVDVLTGTSVGVMSVFLFVDVLVG